MDYETLVDEIAVRVSARLAEYPAEAAVPSDGVQKPRVLVLTEEHGMDCHKVFENAALCEKFTVECALLNDYSCDIASYEAVALFGLTANNINRLAGGVCDTPFSTLAQKALMLGKKVYAAEESIEIFKYKDTMSCAYYQLFADKLALLKKAGLTICPASSIAEAILGASQDCCDTTKAPEPPKAAGIERIDKRLISERDIAAVCKRGLARVEVGSRAIVTDLAREYAASSGVEIVRI